MSNALRLLTYAYQRVVAAQAGHEPRLSKDGQVVERLIEIKEPFASKPPPRFRQVGIDRWRKIEKEVYDAARYVLDEFYTEPLPDFFTWRREQAREFNEELKRDGAGYKLRVKLIARENFVSERTVQKWIWVDRDADKKAA